MHKNICGGENGANLLCKCFLVISSRPTSPQQRLCGGAGVGVGLPMLLTGILCVDECAGLTAQCAYLIGAAPLSRRVSPSLSLSLAHLIPVFILSEVPGESVPLGYALQPPHSVSERLMELPRNAH